MSLFFFPGNSKSYGYREYKFKITLKSTLTIIIFNSINSLVLNYNVIISSKPVNL